ncbi:DNA-directed RNA polymerases II 24 kDa polypeptide (RNA polymerase II subunit 5) [Xylographa vitiligo]|nr:DNA-directed RNA polymerases II 24 kDa polypeptide (RNA polymerase II subunit 5) [Xylographa vitiligo]
MSAMDLDERRSDPETEREQVRLWRAWRTIHEMCQDRGYELSEDEVRISLEDFRAQYCNDNTAIRRKLTFQANPSSLMVEKYALPNSTSPTVGPIWVEFSNDQSIGVKQMRTFCQHVHSNHFHSGILVTQTSVTAAALKIIPAVMPCIIETFQEQDLLVNITHHELVPKHVLLSADEKKRLLDRYRLKESQLPRIQTGDPVAKYLGLRRGQVVKIIRKSETAGRYASYRWAI